MEIINFLGDRLGSGGIESFLVNVMEGMEKFAFYPIILISYRSESIYEKKFSLQGIKVIALSENRVGYFSKMKKFASYIIKHKEAVLHIHASSAGMYTYAFVARIVGVKKIIYHVHSTLSKSETKLDRLKNKLLRNTMSWIPEINVACSSAAGIDLFGNKAFEIVSNGVVLERFSFNQTERERIRERLNIGSMFVIGQIGRFSPQKNQLFMLRLLKVFIALNLNVHLLLIGEGKDEEKLRYYAAENKLEDFVTFIAPTVDIESYYSAFDLFVLPSKWEGFGIVALEAQISGLPMLCSENIIDDVILLDSTAKLQLKEEEWISAVKYRLINSVQANERIIMSEIAVKECIKRGYSCQDVKKKICDLYNQIS